MKIAIVALSVGALVLGGLLGYASGKSAGIRQQTTAGPKTEAPAPEAAPEAGEPAMSLKAHELHATMRKLWTDHTVWTREYVIAAVDGNPISEELVAALGKPVGSIATAPIADTAVSALGPGDAAAVRLLKNQEDIGAAVAAYYGKEAGDQMTALLKEHILIAVRLIEAAKEGEEDKMKEEDAKWRKNADDIATFLSAANPNWPKQALLDMMNMHLDTTGEELKARLAKNYNGDVSAYDLVYDHILVMADALSTGIVKQFPDKF